MISNCSNVGAIKTSRVQIFKVHENTKTSLPSQSQNGQKKLLLNTKILERPQPQANNVTTLRISNSNIAKALKSNGCQILKLKDDIYQLSNVKIVKILPSSQPVNAQKNVVLSSTDKKSAEISQTEANASTDKNKRTFMCKVCGKCFKTKSKLIDHEHIHKGLKLYKCETCYKAFRLKHHLKYHIGKQKKCFRP